MQLSRLISVLFVFVLTLAFAPVVTVGQGNTGGTSGAAQACKQGGYTNYTAEANGEAFGTIGECIRFAAQGNDLVAIGSESPISTAYLSIAFGEPYEDDYYDYVPMTIKGAGLDPGSDIYLELLDPSSPVSGPQAVDIADEDGNYFFEEPAPCKVSGVDAEWEASGTAADGSRVSDSAIIPC